MSSSRPDTSVIAATAIALVATTALSYVWLSTTHAVAHGEGGSLLYPLAGDRPRGGYPYRWPFLSTVHRKAKAFFPTWRAGSKSGPMRSGLLIGWEVQVKRCPGTRWARNLGL